MGKIKEKKKEDRRGEKSSRPHMCRSLFLPAAFPPPCTLFPCFPARSLAHFCPFLMGEKNRERHTRAPRETGRGAGPTKTILALLVGLLLLFSSRLTCSHVPAPEPHRHRLRTTRALPPNAPKETSGNLSAAAPTVRETLSSFRCTCVYDPNPHCPLHITDTGLRPSLHPDNPTRALPPDPAPCSLLPGPAPCSLLPGLIPVPTLFPSPPTTYPRTPRLHLSSPTSEL